MTGWRRIVKARWWPSVRCSLLGIVGAHGQTFPNFACDFKGSYIFAGDRPVYHRFTCEVCGTVLQKEMT